MDGEDEKSVVTQGYRGALSMAPAASVKQRERRGCSDGDRLGMVCSCGTAGLW